MRHPEVRPTARQAPQRRSTPPGGGRLRRWLAAAAALAALLAGIALPDAGTSAAESDAFGGWETTASLKEPRQDHTATRLADGTMLAAGGELGTDDAESYGSAERYEPVSATWRDTGCFGNARGGGHAAVTLADDTVLVIDDCGPTAEVYDPANDSWTPTAPRTTSHGVSGAIRLDNGEVLAVDGGSGQSERYDPDRNQWEAAAELNLPRGGHTTTRLDDGRVLVAGGRRQNETVASAEIYDPKADSWEEVSAPMGVDRTLHTATLLKDGRVLVAGGWKQQDASPGLVATRNFTSVASAEIFDPKTGTWIQAAPLPQDRAVHTATRMDDGRVLVAGGYRFAQAVVAASEMLTTAAVYDPQAGTWSEGGELSQPRQNHTAALLPDGRAAVFGGRDQPSSGGDATSSVEVYEPAQNRWVSGAAMAYPRSAQASVVIAVGSSEEVLVVGGGRGEATTSAERYDPSAPADEAWSFVREPRPPGRAGHTATLLPDGKVLAVGGRSDAGVQPTAEVYDPATEVWSPADELNTARSGHTATLLADGRVLVAGGHDDAGEPLASAEVYDPGTDRWTPVGNLATARRDHAAILLGTGQVLVTGGRGPGGALKSAERYLPQGKQWAAAPSMGTARSGHTATALNNGEVAVAGGSDTDGAPVVAVERYRPGAGGEWSNASASMDTARSHHTATMTSDGRLLVAGGNGADGDPLGSAEVYEPAKDNWTRTGDLKVARSHHAAVLLGDGRVLAVGGDDSASDTATNAAELFDSGGSPSGTWSPTGGLSQARTGHTATLLDGPACEGDPRPDWCGQVLVVGGAEGRAYEDEVLSSAELYDPADDSWTPAGDLATARADHTATLLDGEACESDPPDWCGKVLVVGGDTEAQNASTSISPIPSAELYDPTAGENGSWTDEIDGLAAPRSAHTATLLSDGDVLIAGGKTGQRYPASTHNSAERYDPDTGAWGPAGSMTRPKQQHTATLMDEGDCGHNCGNVLVANGQSTSAPTAEVYVPAGDTGAWRSTQPPSEDHSAPTATLLRNGRILRVGAEAETYNPETESWSTTTEMSVSSRGHHTATRLPNDQVLVAGGGLGSTRLSAELYDPDAEEADDEWRETASLAKAREEHTATQLPPGPLDSCGTNCGKVLVAGGHDLGAQASAELYAPAPRVDSVSPGEGPFWGGTEVTLTGTGLASVRSVTFGGLPVPPEDVERDQESPDTTLTVTTPAMEVGGTVPVRVTTDGGTSASVDFTFLGPPGKITNLSADAVAADEIHVSFDAVGKNGFDEPPASEYVVKQASAPIRTDAQFDSAGEPCGGACTFSPTHVGDRVVLEVSGLQPDTEYHYAAKAANDDGNVGPLSNTDRARTPGTGDGDGDGSGGGTGGDGGTGSGGDGTTGEDGGGTGEDGAGTGGDGDGTGDGDPTGPAASGPGHPGQVIDLTATRLSRSEVRLTWSATGVDGELAPPAGDYVVKQATEPITEAGFADAFTLCDEVCGFGPSEVGEQLTLTVGNLEPNTTYHYRLHALETTGTPGPLSNQAQVTTTPGDLTEVCPTGQIDPAPFTDRSAIPEAHLTMVDCAYFHQIVSGFEDGAYHPARAVRRDQMATFIAGALDAGGVELPPAGEGGFTDVAADSVHGEAIDRLAAAGIVVGGPGGLPADAYGPAQRIRRDQMASFLVRAVEYAVDADLEAEQSGYFADVPPGNVHAANVDVAAERGLAHGFGDDTYRPGGDTRRDQMGTFVIRLLNELGT